MWFVGSEENLSFNFVIFDVFLGDFLVMNISENMD